MRNIEPTPVTWAREAWKRSSSEILLPAAAGIALAQFLTTVFALRSAHQALLLLCVAASGFALLRTFALLVKFSRAETAGRTPRLHSYEMWELFLPLLASIALYGLIAPSARFAVFFAAASLPHLVMLAYFAKQYAVDTAPLPRLSGVLTFEAIGAPVLQVGRALKGAMVSVRSVEKIPQIG